MIYHYNHCHHHYHHQPTKEVYYGRQAPVCDCLPVHIYDLGWATEAALGTIVLC